jgi:PKHD-type hydroxylase
MLIEIEDVLTASEVTAFRAALADAPWSDGRATAGYQSALAKRNRQLAGDCAVARNLGQRIVAALERNLLFQTAALPDRVFPPLFNAYAGGEAFGAHIDNAYRPLPGGGRMRTDLSATLFLSDPAEYDGGELVIEDGSLAHRIRLPAGHMILYPATTLHRVEPVTRGERLASFFWIRSLVPDQRVRQSLFDIDLAIQSLRGRVGDDDPALIALTGAYHNLLRIHSVAAG